MNFDEALQHYAPRAWFRLRFFKYKHLGRGEAELALIRHLVTPGSLALDVGCSIGIYAAEMARYAARIVAFEANPSIAAFAARVAPRNVEVINVALSAAPGRARLSIPLNRKGKGISELGTIEASNPVHAAPTQTVEIEMKRLDDFGFRNCSFLKLDVEGHEQAVFEGARQLIAAQRPTLMAELDEGINPGTVQRFAAPCAALSYQGYFLSGGKLRPLADFDPTQHQDQSLLGYSRKTFPAGREYINNFVFVPAEKAERLLAQV